MQPRRTREEPGPRDAGSHVPPPAEDDWPTLSAEERVAIDDIRRQLARESSAAEPPAPPSRWRQVRVAAVLLGVSVLGGIAGSVVTLLWMGPRPE